MATRRTQRATAGNRLEQLLAQETSDDFYQQELFQEEANDDEFEDSGPDEDLVDSDFDIDETDAAAAAAVAAAATAAAAGGAALDAPDEDGDDERASKRPRSKAYVDPRRAKPAPRDRKPAAKRVKSEPDSTAASSPSSVSSPVVIAGAPPPWHGERARKHLRHSTQQRTLSIQHKWLEQQERRQTQPKPRREPERRLTQEELLEEAKETERLNMASLDAYRRREEEAKKAVKKKPVVLTGPRIVLLSRACTATTDLFLADEHHLSGQSAASVFQPADDVPAKRKLKAAAASATDSVNTVVVAAAPTPAAHPLSVMVPGNAEQQPIVAGTKVTFSTAQAATTAPAPAPGPTPAVAPIPAPAVAPAAAPAAAPAGATTPAARLPERSTRGKTKVFDDYYDTGLDVPSSPPPPISPSPAPPRHSVNARLLSELDPNERYTRNLVSFHNFDAATLPGAVTLSKIPYAPRVPCVVTGRPARYLDPLTQQPCADLAAFRVLRERHRAKSSTVTG